MTKQKKAKKEILDRLVLKTVRGGGSLPLEGKCGEGKCGGSAN